jgi:hypothetical protein
MLNVALKGWRNVTVSDSSRKTQHSRLSLLVIVFLGLAMAICATVAMPWPSDVMGEPHPRLVPHWERLASTTVSPDFPAVTPDIGWFWRRVWDGLDYVLLLGGLACAVWATLRPRRLPWIWLAAVGLLGMLYAGGVAVYNGPLVATPGYLLVLIAAVLALLTWQRPTPPEESNSPPDASPTEAAPADSESASADAPEPASESAPE